MVTNARESRKNIQKVGFKVREGRQKLGRAGKTREIMPKLGRASQSCSGRHIAGACLW
jgi:hypothetical protein